MCRAHQYRQDLGLYQINQIVVNDQALRASHYFRNDSNSHPSIGTVFEVGSSDKVSCPLFSNFSATQISVAIDDNDTLVGEFQAIASNTDTVTYAIQDSESNNGNITADLLTIDADGTLSFKTTPDSSLESGAIIVKAMSSLNTELARMIIVNIIINRD